MTATAQRAAEPRQNGNGDVEMVEPPRGLWPKLVEAISEVSHVEKDGFNEHFKYKFASAEAILAALRGPLLSRGILLLPHLSAVTTRAGARNSTITTVEVEFTLRDAESGEQYVATWAGQGDDPSDKGLGKAYTSAIKTFLRETFMLPLGDDPEADTRADERTEGGGETAPAVERVSGEKVAELSDKFESLLEAAGDEDERKLLKNDLKLFLGSKGVPTPSVRRAFAAITPALLPEVETWLAKFEPEAKS